MSFLVIQWGGPLPPENLAHTPNDLVLCWPFPYWPAMLKQRHSKLNTTGLYCGNSTESLIKLSQSEISLIVLAIMWPVCMLSSEAQLLIPVPSVVVLSSEKGENLNAIEGETCICIAGLEPAPVVLEPVWTFRYSQVFSRTAVLIRFRTRRGNLPRTADYCETSCNFGRKLA